MICLLLRSYSHHSFFFFNDTATTEIYTLSLHDALPISPLHIGAALGRRVASRIRSVTVLAHWRGRLVRSEEHTSELQSQSNLVCRLLLEKKNPQQLQTPSQHRGEIPHNASTRSSRPTAH